MSPPPSTATGRRSSRRSRARRAEILDTAHLACLEAPLDFAAAVRRFFAGPVRAEAGSDAAATLYEAGLEMRRKVLGDAWVDRSLANRTPLNADFQAMITRYAWNEIWGRPGLDHRTRRLLVLAITAALGRWEEFRLHVRAGVEQGGFTRGELKEDADADGDLRRRAGRQHRLRGGGGRASPTGKRSEGLLTGGQDGFRSIR